MALKEGYDPHRFDTSSEKWRHWILTNKPNLHADYKNLEGFRSKFPDALTDAAVDFGEPPAAQRKEIMRDLKEILTAPGNLHRDTRANNEFQQALNRDCEEDSAYQTEPSVKALSRLASARIIRWQEEKWASDRRLGLDLGSGRKQTRWQDENDDSSSKRSRREESDHEDSRHAKSKNPTLSAVTNKKFCDGCG